MDFNYDTETITPEQTGLITIGGVQGLEIPAGTSAERPVSPIIGTIRLNTDVSTAVFEYWDGTTWATSSGGGGSGTVTSVAATQPAAGFTITGSPITTSGTLTFVLANDLAAVEGLATTGITVRTATDTWTTRSLTQPAAGITITNADGVAGSPTFALANDLAAVEGLATNGIAVRTGTDTWATRSVVGTTDQITVTNGDGGAGNPTVSIAPNPIIPGTGSLTLTSGTTAERPAPPVNGMIRYNSTTGKTEIYQDGQWLQLGVTVAGATGIRAVYTGVIPATSGTTVVPWDNTIPDVTEGTEIWTRTVVPTNLASNMKFTVPFTCDSSQSNRIVIASLFRGTLNIGAAVWYATGGGRPNTITLSVSDFPNTLGPVTYSMRVGVGGGNATWYVNSTSAGNDLGGILVSSYEITEVV